MDWVKPTAASAAASFCFAVAGLLGCADCRADEVQVSTSSMQNVEFDHDDALLQWVDGVNRLWVAHVDTTTGNFVPSSGMETLVDQDAAAAATFGNGPEWVHDTAGYSLVYTKYQPGTAANKSATTAFIAKAALTAQGWQVSALPNTLGMVDQEGNLNPTQADPPVVFHDGTATGTNATMLYLQGVNDTRPVAVPNSLNTDGSARFVTGLNELIYTTPVVSASGRGWRQVFSYNVDTGVTTQLTADSGNKGVAFMWQAPEYNGAYVLMTTVNATTLKFYTLQYNPRTHTNQWTAVATIPAPVGAPAYVWSPEPFVYNGKSYIYMVRSTSSNAESLAVPTQIWLASMDNRYNVQVSDPAVKNRVRVDPKYFVTSTGVYIYYIRYTVAVKGAPSQPDGVWRSQSGLPLP